MSFIIKLFQCFFSWKIKPDPEERLIHADVILCQSFGLRRRSHGRSNRAMADIVRSIYEKKSLPLVSQWEIADCLAELPKALVVRGHRIQGEYLDTYESLCQQWDFCQKKGWKKAVLVAHPDHYWRCMMAARRVGFEVVAVDTSSVPYDPYSAQGWTKSREKFMWREIVARIIYLFTGKL